MSHKQQGVIGRLTVVIGLPLGTFFAGFPIFWVIYPSFKLNPETFTLPFEVITKSFSLDAYTSIFRDSEKLHSFADSYFIVETVAILTLLVAILAPYVSGRYEFPGRKIINTFIVLIQAIPPITLLVPYFGLMMALKLYNAYQRFISTHMVLTLLYAITMLTGHFNTLPRELDEAAKAGGSTSFGALRRIFVLISIPGILSVTTHTPMIARNEYLFALTLIRTNDMRIVPISIQLLVGQHSYDWNETMAISVLDSISAIILFIFSQRYSISGITSGSVKS